MPYTAPEVFSKETKYSPASDVHGFGQLSHEIIFERFPLDVSKRALDKLREQYRGNYNSLIELVVPEKAGRMGPQIIMEMVELLMLKAIGRNPLRRPIIEWNVIALREAFSLLDRTY